jgi:hypothetical protein
VQILRNTLPMQAGLCMATDKAGHDHCIVVAKASYEVTRDDSIRLAEHQAPLVYADLPSAGEGSSTAWETDFAPYKPLTDVIVLGKAIAPGRVPAREVAVRLEVEGRSKDALVFGERCWTSAAGFVHASPPVPFVEMPLVWERAVGGADDPRNPVGVGRGERLPNVEDPLAPLGSPRERPTPRGFAWVGRSWQPRCRHAGTYDARWRREVCPLLPDDFDLRYFQAAPLDQQFAHFRGGERIRCVHMADDPVVEFRIPAMTITAHFEFVDHRRQSTALLDTVVLEPRLRCMHLTWRTSTPLGKQITRLRGVYLGEAPEHEGPIGHRRGRPHFAGLGSFVRWAKRHDRGGRS